MKVHDHVNMFALKTAVSVEPHFLNAMGWRGRIPDVEVRCSSGAIGCCTHFSSALHFPRGSNLKHPS